MTYLDVLIVASYVVGMTCFLVYSILWLFITWGVLAGIIGLIVACGIIYVSGAVVEE